MKLDKRVSNLEAKRGGAVSIKSHIIGVGEGQTEEEAKDTYGRERIGTDDMVIFLIGMSAADGDEQDNSSLADNPQCAYSQLYGRHHLP